MFWMIKTQELSGLTLTVSAHGTYPNDIGPVAGREAEGIDPAVVRLQLQLFPSENVVSKPWPWSWAHPWHVYQA